MNRERATQRQRLAMRAMGICFAIDLVCLIGTVWMTTLEHYADAVLFFVAFSLALIVGCLVRQVFHLFDTDTFGDPWPSEFLYDDDERTP